jgi:cytochrome c
MSAFEWNKVIGAVLVALLVTKLIDMTGDAAFHPKQLAKPAYPIAVAASSAKTKPAEAAKPEPVKLAAIGPLLAKASTDAGKGVARKCTICHSFNKGGRKKVGPNLWATVGSDKAKRPFTYSAGFKKLSGKWDYESLNAFLANPKAYAPGTIMGFAGIPKASDRAALIAYMRSLADSPVPLP